MGGDEKPAHRATPASWRRGLRDGGRPPARGEGENGRRRCLPSREGRRLRARGIPRQLAQNAGVEVVRVVTDLRSRHAQGDMMMGIDGETGKLINVKEAAVLDSFAVKQQVMRASIETAAMLLRIDQIVSGISHGKAQKMGAQQEAKKKPDNDENDEIKPLQQ